MTKRRFTGIDLVGLAVAVVLGGCSTAPPLNSKSPTKPKYAVYEMRSMVARPVHSTGDKNIAWIDEERVLFEGLDRTLRDPVKTDRGVSVAARRLYIWNIRTNEVVRHTREPLGSALCFADGYVAYSVYRDGRTAWLEGPFGSEHEVAPISDGRSLNAFTCASYERSTLPMPKIGGGIEPLRPEHGWIEHTGNSTWYRGLDGTLIQLSYQGRPIGTVRPQKYSSHSKTYIFWRPSQATWLIEPNGTVLRQAPPIGGTANEVRFEPAGHDKTLWRLTRINVRAMWDPGASGLYLYTVDGKPERLITGVIDAMQVHVGGCLVAAIVDPWDREEREHRLTAVNICR